MTEKPVPVTVDALPAHAGAEVELRGWLQHRRSSGKVQFLLFRDGTGVVQAVMAKQDVPDDTDARLVVLGIDHPYSKEPGSAAERAAKAIFESRGNTPRLLRNTLVFLAVDQTRLQELDEAVRRDLAWESILSEKEALNLDPHQVKQAETQKASADGAVTARLPEAYQ
jgi:hypothetical protein